MYLYYAVHFDELDDILDNGLGIMLGETDTIPIQLELCPYSAEVARMMTYYKLAVEYSPNVVVLCVELSAIEDKYLEPKKSRNGYLIRYIYTEIIDSSKLSVVWADNILSFSEFMCVYAQLRDQCIAASESETLLKCVQWFMMGDEKREAIFNSMGRWVGGILNDMSKLTGYSADLLGELWRYRESVYDIFASAKESYETGVIVGMYKAGCSIEQIMEEVNWQRQSILSVLKENGL